MATQTRRASTKKAATAKPAPEAEVEDEELEELEEDEATEAPAKAAAQAVTFGVADLCKLINKKRASMENPPGKNDVTPRELRTLIRKMARDNSGRVDREIVAGNRSRYDWSGPKDPEVLAIVKAYFGGELEADKAAKLQALKEQKAAKVAAAPAKPAAKKAPAKKAAAPVVEEDEDDEELELEDED